MKYIATINDTEFEIEIKPDGSITINGEPRSIDFLHLDEKLYSIITEGRSYEALVEHVEHHYDVLMGGKLYNVQVLDERAKLMANRHGGEFEQSGEISIQAPMPGLIVKVPVREGQTVTKGQTVVILESMKMQNELKTPRDGTVQRVSVKPGESVEQKRVLITIM